jgi:L-Ala-D/L-Glu epimerase
MKIERFEIYTMDKIRYRRVFKISRGVGGGPNMKNGFHVLVKIFTDEGIVGLGEVRPANPYQGESTWGVYSTISRFYAPALLGRDPFDIANITETMEQILPDNPYARTPIDLALHDIMGKALGVPVYQLLGGLCNKQIAVKYPLGQGTPEEILDQAIELTSATGARFLKLKIGPLSNLQTDLKALALLRQHFGDKIGIQVDANAGYRSPFEALKAIIPMLEFNPVLVEQPLSRWDVDGLAVIKEKLNNYPLLADESLWTPQDAFILLKKRACDVLNAKVPKAGGLFRGKMIAAVAEGAGAQVFVGSTGESGIGAAAGLHFHASTKNMWHYTSCMWGPYILVHDFLTEESRIRVKDGYVYAPTKPGLGVELDEKALQTYKGDMCVVK